MTINSLKGILDIKTNIETRINDNVGGTKYQIVCGCCGTALLGT